MNSKEKNYPSWYEIKLFIYLGVWVWLQTPVLEKYLLLNTMEILTREFIDQLFKFNSVCLFICKIKKENGYPVSELLLEWYIKKWK